MTNSTASDGKVFIQGDWLALRLPSARIARHKQRRA
jgi:hypothetical protein